MYLCVHGHVLDTYMTVNIYVICVRACTVELLRYVAVNMTTHV